MFASAAQSLIQSLLEEFFASFEGVGAAQLAGGHSNVCQPRQHLTDNGLVADVQKQFAAERVAGMLEDRRIREAEIEAYQAAAAERSAKLCARIEYLERALQETTKDYILGAHWCTACSYAIVWRQDPMARVQAVWCPTAHHALTELMS